MKQCRICGEIDTTPLVVFPCAQEPKEIFSIELNGDILLRGKVIANDLEVTQSFKGRK